MKKRHEKGGTDRIKGGMESMAIVSALLGLLLLRLGRLISWGVLIFLGFGCVRARVAEHVEQVKQ